jgi:hypothetical protein
MLDFVIQPVTGSRKVELYRTLREITLQDLKRDCIKRSVCFYPKEVQRPALFGQEVEEYIEKKARQDLPPVQFESRQGILPPPAFMEIGGFLGYDSKLFEIAYSTDSRVEVREGGLQPELYIRPLNEEDLARACSLIGWHSHPSGSGEPSFGDIVYLKDFYQKFSPKQFHYLIFLPEIDQAIWYEIEKVEKLQTSVIS